MPQVVAHPPGSDQDTSIDIRTAAVAWVVAAIFYFYQYVLRSAPSVMMPQLSEAFALSSTGRGLDPGPVLLRVFAIQPCCRRCDGPVGTEERPPDCCGRGRHRGAVVRHRPQRFGERRQSTPGSWGSLCTCGSHLHRHQKLSGVAGRHLDRRYPDVRNGGRIGRAVCRWANDRRGDRLGPFLDQYGHCRLGDGCPSLCSSSQTKREPSSPAVGREAPTTLSTPYSRIRNRYCAA